MSPSWNRCSSGLARLSDPTSTPPGRKTLNASASAANCSAGVERWCSIVNMPTESYEASGNWMRVQSPSSTVTFVSMNSAASCRAIAGPYFEQLLAEVDTLGEWGQHFGAQELCPLGA